MKEIDLEGLALSVHSQLVVLHNIGVLYNRALGNRRMVIFHSWAKSVAERAVKHHLKRISDLSTPK
jgi:hypothetical protein